MPAILDPSTPAAGDSAGLGDDELRALKQYLADTFGLPVAPNQLLNPIGSTTNNGAFTFTSPSGGQRSLPGIVGLIALNNAAVPNKKFDMGAKYLSVKRPSDESVIGLRTNSGCVIDTELAGPTPNGRDQFAVIPVASFVHFYWIYNPSTDAIAGIVSLNPNAPILPAGYTHFVYATTVLKDGSGNLIRVRQRGSWVWFEDAQPIMIGGLATTETFVNYTSIFPAEASNLMIESRITSNLTTVTGFDELRISFLSGTAASTGPIILSSSIVEFAAAQMRITIPNIGLGGLYYQIVKTSTGAVGIGINGVGYQVSNGDS